MLNIIENLLARVTNFITVISSELTPIFPYERLINGLIWLVAFYFISKWFKAYILRVILFILGITLFYDVMGRNYITTSVDFYVSIGLFVPHVSMVELTYLIIKERTLFLVDKTIEIVHFIISPFIWIFEKASNIFHFFQMKQEQSKQKKAEKDYYQEEFKREQERAYKEEQERYNKQDKQRQEENKQQEKKKEYRYDKEESQQSKEEPKNYSRWDSSNAYEVLGVSQSSTKQEIKKAYRNLCKIYHPDVTLTKKQEHTKIFQKINWAYDSLK